MRKLTTLATLTCILLAGCSVHARPPAMDKPTADCLIPAERSSRGGTHLWSNPFQLSPPDQSTACLLKAPPQPTSIVVETAHDPA